MKFETRREMEGEIGRDAKKRGRDPPSQMSVWKDLKGLESGYDRSLGYLLALAACCES